MGVISSLFAKTEKRDLNTTLLGIGWGQSAKSGVHVNEDNAMTSTAVWACVRVLSESIASLPLFVYRRRADGGKERATNHPLYRLLHDRPNPEMTAFEFRELMASHVETWGNAYADIEYASNGSPLHLWPLNPARAEGADRIDGRLFYKYRMPNNEVKWLDAERVLHIRGLLSGDRTFGVSPIKYHMESIGLGLATEEYGARFFSNGARPGGVFTHPGTLSEGAHKRLKDSLQGEIGGLSNAHRMKILEEGMTYQAIGIPPEEAQFLETRKFQVTEVARIFRVPPHMIQDLERSTNNNIEHQGIEFVVNSLRPRLIRFEQGYQRQLLLERDQDLYFTEHLVDGLLRGDIMSRYQAYNTAIQSGFMSRNEVRALENMNPADDLDAYLVPLNMIEAGQPLPEPAQPEPEPRQRADFETRASVASARRLLAGAQLELMLDTLSRIVRRETNDIDRGVTKYLVRADDTEGFLLWLGTFYEEHATFIESQAGPTFRALGQLVLADVARELDEPDLVQSAAAAVREFMGDYVQSMALRWILGNRGQLEAIVRDGPTADETLVELLQARLAGWGETEAQKNATRESVQAVNASAKASYRAAGVTRLRWVASGSENCPYCQALDGRIVGIEQNFVEAGDFAPNGAEPLKVRRSVGHPPVHQGCDCSIVAA